MVGSVDGGRWGREGGDWVRSMGGGDGGGRFVG